MTDDDLRALVQRLHDVLRSWTNVSDDEQAVIREAADALEATLAPVAGEPTAWVATGPNGRVLHFAKEDGWTVDAVMHEPLPPLDPQPSTPVAGEDAKLIERIHALSDCAYWATCGWDIPGDGIQRIGRLALKAADRLAAQAREIAELRARAESAEAECARLRQDAERLDWLDGPNGSLIRRERGRIQTYREAIDRAVADGKREGDCKACKGSGEGRVDDNSGYEHLIACPRCGGSGNESDSARQEGNHE